MPKKIQSPYGDNRTARGTCTNTGMVSIGVEALEHINERTIRVIPKYNSVYPEKREHNDEQFPLAFSTGGIDTSNLAQISRVPQSMISYSISIESS